MDSSKSILANLFCLTGCKKLPGFKRSCGESLRFWNDKVRKQVFIQHNSPACWVNTGCFFRHRERAFLLDPAGLSWMTSTSALKGPNSLLSGPLQRWSDTASSAANQMCGHSVGMKYWRHFRFHKPNQIKLKKIKSNSKLKIHSYILLLNIISVWVYFILFWSYWPFNISQTHYIKGLSFSFINLWPVSTSLLSFSKSLNES